MDRDHQELLREQTQLMRIIAAGVVALVGNIDDVEALPHWAAAERARMLRECDVYDRIWLQRHRDATEDDGC